MNVNFLSKYGQGKKKSREDGWLILLSDKKNMKQKKELKQKKSNKQHPPQKKNKKNDNSAVGW